MTHLRKQVLEAYKNLLKYSKLVVDHQIFFRNVTLSQNSHIHQIYTQNKSKNDLPHLVLLHGFAGTAMSYIRVFHNLSKHYQVHALDHYGNGFSSRSKIGLQLSTEQILDTYVNSIQQWRNEKNINKFTLVGHSFGGYLATLYASKNCQKVNRLLLLSPVGTSNKQQIQKQYVIRMQKSIKKKFLYNLSQKIYQLKLQPYKLFSKPIIGDLILNRFLKSKIKLQKQEFQMWKQYLVELSQNENCLQKSFYQCFQWPFISKVQSISQMIQKFQRPIRTQFFYGQNDWTQSYGAVQLSKKNKNISFQIMKGVNHNMIFDYPLEVTNRIINITT